MRTLSRPGRSGAGRSTEVTPMDGDTAKSCLACGTVGVRMSICKVCKDEFGEKNHYCSKSCQASDWKVHKEYHRNHQSRRTMNCQLTVSSFQQYPFDDDLFFGLMDNPEGPTNVLQLVLAICLPIPKLQTERYFYSFRRLKLPQVSDILKTLKSLTTFIP